MNLTELSDLLSSATDVLRVETLDAYSSPSDADYLARFRAGDPKPDPSEKQPWLDRLAAAAERGHPWRRLRVVNRPVSEYTRYACAWGYVDNVAAGEDVRVFDGADDETGADLRRYVGDFYVLDNTVIAMKYDRPSGRFVEAHAVNDRLAQMRRGAERDFASAQPFREWWDRNVDLHRSLASA